MNPSNFSALKFKTINGSFIAGVAQVLASNGINILDISQTILQEFLVMVMVADMSASPVDLITLEPKFMIKSPNCYRYYK